MTYPLYILNITYCDIYKQYIEIVLIYQLIYQNRVTRIQSTYSTKSFFFIFINISKIRIKKSKLKFYIPSLKISFPRWSKELAFLHCKFLHSSTVYSSKFHPSFRQRSTSKFYIRAACSSVEKFQTSAKRHRATFYILYSSKFQLWKKY